MATSSTAVTSLADFTPHPRAAWRTLSAGFHFCRIACAMRLQHKSEANGAPNAHRSTHRPRRVSDAVRNLPPT